MKKLFYVVAALAIVFVAGAVALGFYFINSKEEEDNRKRTQAARDARHKPNRSGSNGSAATQDEAYTEAEVVETKPNPSE